MRTYQGVKITGACYFFTVNLEVTQKGRIDIQKRTT